MNLKSRVTPNTLYSKYVAVLNGVLRLSKRVTEVLVLILQLDAAGDKHINKRHARSVMMSTLNISESNLSLYMKALKDKGIIVKGGDGEWVLNDYLRPNITGNIVEITFTLEIANGNNEPNKIADYETQGDTRT